MDLNISNHYSGPYRWDEAKERIPNDYRTKDDKPNFYGPAMTKQEEEDYYEKLAEIELDSINF